MIQLLKIHINTYLCLEFSDSLGILDKIIVNYFNQKVKWLRDEIGNYSCSTKLVWSDYIVLIYQHCIVFQKIRIKLYSYR
jgi:hypothetical protein